MNVFFDVDGTILGEDGSVRPHTREVFEQLVAAGHTIYVWSGVGRRTNEVRWAGLDPYVTGIYVKPLSDFDEGLTRHGIPVTPEFIIDDYRLIVEHFGGLQIRYYERAGEPDDELLTIPGLVAAMVLARAEAEIEAESEAEPAS